MKGFNVILADSWKGYLRFACANWLPVVLQSKDAEYLWNFFHIVSTPCVNKYSRTKSYFSVLRLRKKKSSSEFYIFNENKRIKSRAVFIFWVSCACIWSIEVTNKMMEQLIFQNTTPWMVRGAHCKCVSKRNVIEFLIRKSNICAQWKQRRLENL